MIRKLEKDLVYEEIVDNQDLGSVARGRYDGHGVVSRYPWGGQGRFCDRFHQGRRSEFGGRPKYDGYAACHALDEIVLIGEQ